MKPGTNPATASKHYRMLELQSRVECASPHGLVGLLYEELLRALDLSIANAKTGQISIDNPHVSKASSILIALESSLDPEKGGALALSLSRIYRACSQGLLDAAKSNDIDKLIEIREAISQIAYSWQALASD